MEFSNDFDLHRLVEEKKALIVKPQIRFLWQCTDLLEEYRKKAAARFGVPFDWGFDGVCLHQVRTQPAGWYELRVKENFCRIDFTDEESLRRGLDFCFDQWGVTPDGTMFLPCGIWTFEVGKDCCNDEKD